MWDKARKILYRGGEILELLMAAAVVAGILVAMITLVPELARYWEHRTTAGHFWSIWMPCLTLSSELSF